MEAIFAEIRNWFCEIGLFRSIEMFAGIGTFIASLIALFTLREVRNQRKDSIRPNLFIKHGGIAYCFPNSENLIFRGKWSRTENDKDGKLLTYDIVNAGNGVAEEFNLIEEFDLKKAISYIKKYDRENEIHFIETEYGFDLRTSFDETFDTNYRQKSRNIRELGYVLTQSQDKKGTGYHYDTDYLLFMSCFDYLKNKYDRFLSLDDFPPNYLTLRYKDSAGNKYKREFVSKFMTLSEHSYIVQIEDKKFTDIK
jgi:hypothetical protein